jgi:hypothetical protein
VLALVLNRRLFGQLEPLVSWRFQEFLVLTSLNLIHGSTEKIIGETFFTPTSSNCG